MRNPQRYQVRLVVTMALLGVLPPYGMLVALTWVFWSPVAAVLAAAWAVAQRFVAIVVVWSGDP